MRISTSQIFSQSLNAMQQQTASLQKTQLQIASGLRILKPSDDPGGAVKVLNLNTNIGMIDQYSRNSGVAQATLSQQDSVLSNINDALQRIRELSVQGMSPTNHDSARTDIAVEIDQRYQELIALANTRDANGEYLFAGGAGDVLPFLDSGSGVSYQGDQTSRELPIGDGAKINVRDAGDQVFMQIPGGDGTVQVKAGASNRGTLLVGQFSGSANFVPGNYTVTFSAGAVGQPMNYTVTDSAVPPNTVTTGTYQDGQSLNFAGVKMALTGTPVAGDSITIQPAQSQSVFATVKGIASALRIPAGNNSNSAAIQNQMGQGLGNIDQALNAINDQRAAVGARLSRIDNMDSINADFKVQLETLKSGTQDLDYADAISRFNQQTASLQAAQQAFSRTSELSLFKYL
jgi:flagellar hook-associated protein 3 FlgL